MLLIIHNLPKDVTSSDVRQLLLQCGLAEVILDNLQDEGPGKRITVGLAEEDDANILMQKLNGLHYKKCQLYVEDVRKKKFSAPSYPLMIPAGLQPQATRSWYQYPVRSAAPTLPVNNSNLPYYMTQDANNTNFGKQTEPTRQDTSVFNRNYQNNQPAQVPKAHSYWGYPPVGSNLNKTQVSQDPPSTQGYQNDRDKHGDRDKTSRPNWRENKSPPSKRHENFGNFSRREPTRFGDKKSDWNKNTDNSRRHVDDRSPPRDRDDFRQKTRQKDDRGDAFDTSRRSRSSRSNTRDNDSYNERQSDRDQNNSFGRQSERVFDQDERRNDRKRNYESTDRHSGNVVRPERFVYKSSTTFNSKPENSSFTKPNRSMSNKIMGSGGFGATSKNMVQFPSPKPGPSKPQVNFPATKRARFDPPPQNFGNKKYVNPNGPFSIATDYQKMMTRHTNWRIQSATLLAKEVLKNASAGKLDNSIFKTVLKKLRECILLRLDVLMGDKIAANLDEILRGYRTKFHDHDDINFFKAVMEKVEREKEENADEVTDLNESQEQQPESGKFDKSQSVLNPFYSTKPKLPLKPNIAKTQTQKGLASQNEPKKPFMKDPKTTPRLPRYPNSDKQAYKQRQKNALLENEAGFYELEPEFDVAVNEEVEKLVECYIEACEPSSDQDENVIRNKIITSTADEFKNIIKLHVTKRVLNVTDGLVLRIFSSPKPPPKAALDEFLKQHGAISLKKSETTRMFVASCDSYESYDRLLALQTHNFGHVTIQIKPFHVLGSVPKKNKQPNKIDAIEDFTKDVEGVEIDLTIDDPDVMLVENEESEVVVIRDDLDKSINYGNKSTNDDENNCLRDASESKTPNSNDKIDDFNEKMNSNDNVNNSNDKDDDNNVGLDNFYKKGNTSNEKVENPITKVNDELVANEKVGNSDNEVSGKIADSTEDPTSQGKEEINLNEKDGLESIDDILNEANDILEDDLEDF